MELSKRILNLVTDAEQAAAKEKAALEAKDIQAWREKKRQAWISLDTALKSAKSGEEALRAYAEAIDSAGEHLSRRMRNYYRQRAIRAVTDRWPDREWRLDFIRTGPRGEGHFIPASSPVSALDRFRKQVTELADRIDALIPGIVNRDTLNNRIREEFSRLREKEQRRREAQLAEKRYEIRKARIHELQARITSLRTVLELQDNQELRELLDSATEEYKAVSSII